MGKRIICLAALLVMVYGNCAFASEEVGVEAGVKGWYNHMKLQSPFGSTIDTDSRLVLGPAAEVKLPNHIFFEASYLLTTSDYTAFSFGKLEAERKDLEVTAGYQFIPQLGAYVGYKRAITDFTTTDVDFVVDKSTSRLYGFLAGVRATVPVSEMFSIYGNFTYLDTRSRKSGAEGSESEKAPGTDAELGLKAEFNKHISANAGYRIESTRGKTTKEKERFSGVTFGALYAFQ